MSTIGKSCTSESRNPKQCHHHHKDHGPSKGPSKGVTPEIHRGGCLFSDKDVPVINDSVTVAPEIHRGGALFPPNQVPVINDSVTGQGSAKCDRATQLEALTSHFAGLWD